MRASVLASTLTILAATLLGACGLDTTEDIFADGSGTGGAAGQGGGSDGGAGNASTTGVGNDSSGAAGPSSSSSSSGAGGMPGAVCGNGICESGEPNTCPMDCPVPDCLHPVCEVGDALNPGCDPCVDMVCAQDEFCCNGFWDGNCVQAADMVCNAGCCGDGNCSGESCTMCDADCGVCMCGNGICDGEDCASCEADCGQCYPPADCPHSVCGQNEPLDPAVCQDPCVEEVCAMDANCCVYPNWTGDCAQLALTLCPPDPCITDVCAQDPTCCTAQWDQSCVGLATMLCGTTCMCDHSICDEGAALDPTCNPCAQQLCTADEYCCNSSWDGICVGEVPLICGIDCG